jgi:hypothetical protein
MQTYGLKPRAQYCGVKTVCYNRAPFKQTTAVFPVVFLFSSACNAVPGSRAAGNQEEK